MVGIPQMVGSGIQGRIAANPFVQAMSMGARHPAEVGARPASPLPDEAQPRRQPPSVTATPAPVPTPKLPSNFTADLAARRQAIKDIESFGGDYSVVGVETNGDRPYGAYQVMGKNVGPWTQKYLGRRMTPQEFLRDPAAQDAVFDAEFGSYWDKYGPAGAAQAWFGGPGSVGKTGRKDKLGTSVGTYGQRFVQGLQKYGGQNVALMASSTDVSPAEHYRSRLFGGSESTEEPMQPGSGEQLQKALLQQGTAPAARGGGGVQVAQAEASEAPPVQDEAEAYLAPVQEQLAQRRSQPRQRRGAPQVRSQA